MESRDLLQCSQEPTAGLCPEPDEPIPPCFGYFVILFSSGGAWFESRPEVFVILKPFQANSIVVLCFIIFSVLPGKFQGSDLFRLRPLPFKQFPASYLISHSTIQRYIVSVPKTSLKSPRRMLSSHPKISIYETASKRKVPVMTIISFFQHESLPCLCYR